MKYFTPKWFSGDIEDTEADKIKDNYWIYIDSIYSKLPFPLKLLSKQISLHDAKIISLQVDRKTIVVEAECGDLQVGYFSIVMTYHNAFIDKQDEIFSLMRDHETTILADEFEMLNESKFSHHFLFTSKKELLIFFETISFTITASSEKNYQQCSQIKIISR